jgi:hypothetical protein
MTTWEKVIEFINSHETFMRRDAKRIDENCSYYTVSQYILIWMNCGFLKRISRGSYVRLLKVPTNISSIKAQMIAYNPNLRLKLLRKCKLNQLDEIK